MRRKGIILCKDDGVLVRGFLNEDPKSPGIFLYLHGKKIGCRKEAFLEGTDVSVSCLDIRQGMFIRIPHLGTFEVFLISA